jgi:hypothetical protein
VAGHAAGCSHVIGDVSWTQLEATRQCFALAPLGFSGEFFGFDLTKKITPVFLSLLCLPSKDQAYIKKKNWVEDERVVFLVKRVQYEPHDGLVWLREFNMNDAFVWSREFNKN